MVAIVGGNALGLGLGSMATLGAGGVWGHAPHGRSGEGAFVNAATGNLVLQGRDDLLASRGLDLASIRTYNSLGLLNDDNGDNWSLGFYTRALRLTGTRNTAGSTLTKIDSDGGESTYTWDAGRSLYLTAAGAGAHDTIVYETATSQWLWQDGDTALQERYDSAATGRLLSSKDADGLAVSYTYNGAGLLTSASSASGETVHYDYTGTLLTQVRTVHLVGSTPTTLTRVRYAYDASNRLSSVTVDLSPTDNSVADGKTYVTTYTYDGTSRRVASALQSDGSGLRFTYVQVGSEWRVATIRDALDQTTAFAYDTANRKTTVTSPLGFATTYEYDAAGQLLKVSAPPGQATSFSWDASGNLTRTTDAEGRTVDMAYDANGNQTLVRDGAGNSVTRTFSTTNLLLTETTYAVADPDGAGSGQPTQPMTTRHVWDAAGKRQLRFVVSAEGRILEHRYNGYGERATTIAYAGGAFAVGSLGATQVPTEAEMASWIAGQDKARTQRTDFAYDTRSLLKTATAFATVDASGNGVADTGRSVTQFVYDQAGLLLKTIAPGSGVTETTYDGLGRVLTVKDALGRITTTQYQDSTAKTAVTLASGLVTTSAWDKAGRLVSVIEGTASVASLGETKWFHDANGRLRMTQDPTGVRTWMLYDEAGRQVAGIDADGTVTELSYDRSDRRTRTVVYATRIATTALVDASGKPTNVTLASIRPASTAADRTSWRAYDAGGRLVETVDASGAVVESFYDGASRLVKQVASANRIVTTSLGAAPVASTITPTANAAADRTTRWLHDAEGRVVGVLDAEGYLVETRYDAAGRVSTTTRYATATASAQRATGNLAALRPAAHADDQTTTLIYDAKGQVAGMVDAELRLTEKVYDGNGNLARVVRYATRLATMPAVSASVASLRPAANAEDQVTAWTYDLLDRPSQETNAEGTVTRFAYDTGGNLVTTTKAYGQPEARTLNARFDVQDRLTGELSAEGGALLTGSLTQAQIDAIWVQHGIAHAYDAAGRRISTTDANGNRTLFFFDADGRSTHTVNALGEVEERTYDALGQVASATRLGTRIALTGLTGGLATAPLTSAVAAARNAALDSKETFSYAAAGALASSTDALGNTTSRTVNAFAEQVSVTVALGGGATRTDSRTVDRRGLELTATRDSGGIGALAQAQYDAFGRLIRSVDPNGNVRQLTFDRIGRVVQTVDADGARSTTYDAFDRVLTRTDAIGHVTTTSYTTSGRSVTVKTPEGVSVTTTRTRHGQTATLKDGRGNTTSYAYDRNGNLTTTTTALTVEQQTFDRASRLVETTDARGTKTSFLYDAANRVLTRKVDPTGLALTTTYAFDAKGQRTSFTDPNGTITTTVYDLRGRTLTQTVDPAGLALKTSWTLNAEGQALTVTSPAGAVTRHTYDKLGRKTQEQVDPSGLNLTRSWTYDKNGNALTATDANGKTSRFAYDALDRIVWSVDAAGGASRTAYDKEGRILRVTRYAVAITATLPLPATASQIEAAVTASSGKDSVDARRYDKDGRLRFTVDGTGAVVERRFDANGNVVDRIAYAKPIDLAAWGAGTTDPAPSADPARDMRTRIVYDQLDRITHSADALGAVIQSTYDGNGNVTRTTRYAKTILSTAAPNSVLADPADRIEVFVYDKADRLTLRADASGAVSRSEYDAAGNVVRSTRHATQIVAGADPSTVASNGADRVTRREFDKAGRLAFEADPLGYVTGRTYDGVGRVRTTTRFWLAVPSTSNPSAVVVDAANDRIDAFVYDLAGRLKNSTDAVGGIESFTYDGLGNKLTFSNKKGSVWSYSYDSAGRILSETTPLVHLTAVTASGAALVEGSTVASGIVTQFVHDALGNLKSRTEATGRPEQRTTTYEYDAAGRQVKVTYPPVMVYSETTAALATNGVTGLATRAEGTAATTLTTSTFYDALGNAVANVDVAGSTSLKAYDAAGLVRYELDALGHVTGYGRNAFGEATSVVRYGAATTLAETAPTSAGQAPTSTQISSAVTATGFDHRLDRMLLTAYDASGRATSVTEPQSFVYDTAAGASTAGKRTLNTFDAFGQLVKTAQSSTASSWVDTHHYFDRAGNEVAVVDALGNLTFRTFDAVGNRLSSLEYVSPLAAGGWSATTYGTPAATAKDRKTVFAYDRLNRKVSETRVAVQYSAASNGSSITGNVATTYGYDAVGNLTRTTDALGASVLSFYDALGRVTAVTAPTRTSTVDGSALTPITTFRRDAYGNVVVQVDRANTAVTAVEFVGVSTAATPGFTVGTASVADRASVSKFDASGRVEQSTDATGVSRYFSYNQRAQVAKSWQVVLDAGAPTTLFEAYQYDRLGRLTHVLTPAPSGGAGLTDASTEYNAFGEATKKGVNGRQETFDYDGAGRLWRTNSGDGIAKVFLYDLLGRQTSRISSAGGADDRDLGLLATPDQVHGLVNTRRTDTAYDALGRIVKQTLPQRIDKEGGLRVSRQLTTASVVSSATAQAQESTETWSGTNRVDLSWTSLARLGSGDIRIDLSYATLASTFSQPTARSRSQLYGAAEAASGVSMTWMDAEYATAGGISAVQRVVVYKKDIAGAWQKVLDQSSFGFAGNTIEVTAPADRSTQTRLEMRVAGSTGAYTTHALVDFGNALRFDASLLALGNYEYRIQTTVVGQSQFVSSSGTVTLSDPPLSSIGIPIGYGAAGTGVLGWQTQAGVTQTFRYRAAGTTGAWAALAVATRSGTHDGVDTSALAVRSYDFELLWTRTGEAAAFAHAIGTVTITPPAPPVNVAPVGYPHVTGIAAGATSAGGTAIDGLYWNAASGSPSFRFRVSGGGSWSSVTVSTAGGIGWVSIAGWASGSYDFEIAYVSGSTTVAFGSGVLTVPPNPAAYITGYERNTYAAPIVVGHDEQGQPILAAHYAWSGHVVVAVPYVVTGIVGYETVQEPVYGDVTVTPPNPANYIIGGLRAEYGSPVVVGSDEGGNPILGAHYAWSGVYVVGVPYTERQIIRYDNVQVPVQVFVGYDESGNAIYETRYEWRQQAVWGDVTVNPPNPAQYMTRAPRPIYGSPVVVGQDESGNPVLGSHYRWQGDIAVAVPYTERQIVGYTPVQRPVYGPVTVTPADPSPYVVQTGAPIYSAPVFVGRDESGQPVLGAHYRWQGGVVVGVPYRTVTTPAYTPGYTIPSGGKGYQAAVFTPTNSPAVSLGTASVAAILTQAATKADDTKWLRPSIQQLIDRWGNVLEVSDPRHSAWKTRYEYNANDQVILEMRPNAAGGLDASSPFTQTYYDALGRDVATRDALGRVNGKAYDLAGNLVQEIRADGGVVTYAFGAFGEKLSMTDAVGNAVGATAQWKADNTTRYGYDKLSRLTSTSHGNVNVHAIVQSTMTLSGPTRIGLVETWAYDSAGRKIQQTDGGGRTVQYRYDRRGNVVETRKASTDVVRATFDALGRKLTETDQNNGVNRWTYDDFGRVLTHDDLAAVRYTYTYDFAKQLTLRRATGQDITYAYDAAGQLTQVNDSSLQQVTDFAYELAGKRVLERTTQAGIVYQDNRLAYDTLGRLRSVNDGRVNLQVDYDNVGNRTRIRTRVNLAMAGAGAADDIRNSDRYFLYDAMNRQRAVDAVDSVGNINPTQGRVLRYDLNGNRIEDTWYGNVVQSSGGEQIITGYDESGTAIYESTPVTYTRKTGTRTTETYRYDAMDRLVAVERDGVQVDQRLYDGSSNVLQTGPNGSLPSGYADAMNVDVPQGDVIGTETRRNVFDASGRLLQQRVLKINGSNVNTTQNDILYQYDAAGNVKQYQLKNYDGSDYTNTYVYDYANGRFDGYKDTKISATTSESSLFKPGSTVKTYDKSGNLIRIDDTTRDSNDRTFVNDLAGQTLQVTQNGNVEKQLIVNGEVLGRYGVGVDEVKPRAVQGANQGEQLFKARADFNFGYQPINGNYPTASAGTYSVRTGDTLRSIARGAYGDSELWYRIAEANGLSSDRDLRIGQTLNIPSRVGTVHNDDQSVKPYDPSKIIGDTTPNMPVPNSGKGCGGLAMILVIVVAVVVTVFTAGLAATAIAPATTAAAGTAAAAGGGIAGTFAVGAAALTGTYGAAVGIVAGAIGAAAGSIVSQGVGIAVGVQDSFSWKQVALAAIGGGVSGGIAGYASGSTGMLGNFAVRAAVSNAVSQGIGVATGLQESFSWKGVAAAAVGAEVGSVVGGAVNGALAGAGLNDFTKRVIAGTVSGLAGGLAAAARRGGRVVVAQVAADAFGNALGEGIKDQVAYGGSQQAAVATSYDDGDAARTELRWEGVAQRDPAAIDEFVAAMSTGMPYSSEGVLVAGPGGFSVADAQAQADLKRQAFRRSEIQEMNTAAGPEAALRHLESIDEMLRETRGRGPTRAALYMELAVGGIRDFDSNGRWLILTAMDSYANALTSGPMSGPGTEAARADAAVRIAADYARATDSRLERWLPAAQNRQGFDANAAFLGAGIIKLRGGPSASTSINRLEVTESLSPNVKRTLDAYQASYDDAARLFRAKVESGSLLPPTGLNPRTWEGSWIDGVARGDMNAFKQTSGADDLLVNRRLGSNGGIKAYRVPDLFLERTVIDGTIGSKSLLTPQVRDFFNSGKVDRVILVTPNQKPTILNVDQFRAGKR